MTCIMYAKRENESIRRQVPTTLVSFLNATRKLNSTLNAVKRQLSKTVLRYN